MRLIDADKLLDAMLGENVFKPNTDFDENTRSKIARYIGDAKTEMRTSDMYDSFESASTEFCGVKFLSLDQVKQIIWEWKYGKTE